MCDAIELIKYDQEIDALTSLFADEIIKHFDQFDRKDLNRSKLYASELFCSRLKSELFMRIFHKKIPPNYDNVNNEINKQMLIRFNQINETDDDELDEAC